MVDFKRKGRLSRTIFVAGGGILSLVVSVTLLSAALQNWGFTTATNYTFDSAKIEVSGGLAELKPVTFIHDEVGEFSGSHGNTRWSTDHIELNAAGLSTGSGTYTSQTIDSGAPGTQWGKISWTEVLNQGSSSFSPTKSVGSLSTGLSVYGADIDGDDDIDVVVVQGSSPLVHYFENDGAEAFTARTVDAAKPKNPVDLHVADINKDGRRDLVVLAKGDLVWFENKGGTPPTWKRQDITPSPSTGLEVEVADVNGDGNLDVVIGDEGNVKWYENNGTNPPSWTVQAVDVTLSAVDALSAGDLDGDGDLDLLAGDEAGLYWYESNGANPPLFTKNTIDTTIVNTESIIAADLNKDGKMDVVGVGVNGLNLSWYENDGSSPPGFTKRTVDSGPLTSPVSVSAGDLDRDGNLDLVLVDGADVHWYRNSGGALPAWTKTTLTSGTVGGGDHLFLVNLLDDVNGDDDLDIVVAENNQVSWWENLLPHSNIRFQLRTSTDGTTWSSWQGPGGRTTSSYTDPAGDTINVPNGRYIQYRAFLRTHNSNSLNAQLSMVRLDPAIQSYPKDNPTVQNVTGQSYTSISSFTETLGDGNQGLVKYQISNDGTVWYYHNGSLWVPAAQGFTHANTAAEVNTNISSFDDDVGAGTFFFKAFLNSDGTQPVELDQVGIDYSTVGPATQLVFSVQPSDTEAKVAISPAIKVRVEDANGNLVTTATGAVTLAIGSNAGSATLAGTLTVYAAGGEATFNDVSIDKIATGYTLVASAAGLTSATSAAFDITAGAATQLAFIVQPSDAEAKVAISPAIKVRVQDANGNLVTTATDSITLAIGTNPGGAILAGTLTIGAAGGEATFNNVSIDEGGSGYTLVASAPGLTSATSAAFDITTGAATQLAFSVQPSNAETKAEISPAIKVQVRDAGGELVTTATDSITIAIGTNPGEATLAGSLTVAAVGGEATFSGISIDKAGSGYTLVASTSGLTSATSGAFNITTAADDQVASSDQTSNDEATVAGAAKQLAFSVQPTNAEAKAEISPAVKVQVQDADGKLVTTATDSITLAIGTNPGGGTLSGTLTGTAVGGEATFSGLSIDKAGSGYSLIASAPGLTSATSAGFGITAGQQLASGGGVGGVVVAGSEPASETVTDPANQDTAGDKSAESSKQEAGATVQKKVDTPKKVTKAINKSRKVAKGALGDASSTVPQVPQDQAFVEDESTTALLNRETAVEAGDSVTLQLRAASGLAPEIDVYDANNVLLVSAAVMTEIGSTGVYEYNLALDTSWGEGDYTVVATESTKGTLNRMTLKVGTPTSTEKVGTPTSTDVIQTNTDTVGTVSALLADVQTKLETVDTNLSRAFEEANASPNADAEATAAGAQGLELEPIHASIREINELLRQVSSENGVNLDVIYGSIDETTTDFSELKDKLERLKVLLDLNREVSEKVLEGSKKPVTKLWFESGSVILKILVVNPSKEETLTVPLKIELPKEVSPEDIINLGDLKLNYDTEAELYYVQNEVTLEPGQAMTKLVEMEDIWLFKEERLSSFVNEAKEVAGRLEETPFAEKAALLVQAIEGKIKGILKRQEETTDRPGEHIRAYRQGITTIATIKQDLSDLGKLRQEFSDGKLPGESLLAEGPFSVSEGSDSGEGIVSEDPLEGPEPE